MTRPTFHFLTVVWGEAYTRLYADVVLPTHASAGNAGAFAANRVPGDCYVIYTTRADGETLQRSAGFHELSRLMEVRFEWLDGWFEEGVPKHAMLSKAHKHGIERGAAARAALVFLCPDAIWSDGTFAMLLGRVAAGKRGVMMPGVRVSIESFVPAFGGRFQPDADGVITADARGLVSLGLGHFHQISRTLRWDSPVMNPHCSHVYFPVPASGRAVPLNVHDGEGLPVPAETPMADGDIVGYVMRCWHLHPLMVWPSRFDTRFASTIDGDFVMRACPDPDDLYVVTDSDESVVLEMSPESMNIEPRYAREGRVGEIARWRKMFADPYHRRYAEHNLRLHDGRPGCWEAVERQADHVMRSVIVAGRTSVGKAVRERCESVCAMVRSRMPALPGVGLAGVGVGVSGVKGVLLRGAGRVLRQVSGLQRRWKVMCVGWWLRNSAWYRANSTQWAAHLRRRWWILQHHHRVLMMRGRTVGWHKVLGVRTRWWNLRHGRGPVLLPPRPVKP